MNELTDSLKKILDSLESGHSSLESFQGWLDSCRRPHEQMSYAQHVFLAIGQRLASEADYRNKSKDWDWDPSDHNGPFP